MIHITDCLALQVCDIRCTHMVYGVHGRLPNAFTVPISGGRNCVTVTTLLLIIPVVLVRMCTWTDRRMHGWADDWMAGWVDEWTGRRTDKKTDGQTIIRTDRKADRWIDGQMDGQTERRINGLVDKDGQTDRHVDG